jgi:hypothetical protein
MWVSDCVLDVVLSGALRGTTERASWVIIYSRLSTSRFETITTMRSQFWGFWANHLKSRLQMNNIPVHKT